MLLTENDDNAFEYILKNTVNPDTVSENGIFDDVTITSALRSDMLIHGQKFSNILVKWSLRMIHAESYENIFKFVKVMQ